MMQEPRSKENDQAAFDLKIDRALEAVMVAEAELSQAIAELRPLAVGDKQLITRSLEEFFEKLRDARQSIANLRLLRSRLS
jgi:hypothetical protein